MSVDHHARSGCHSTSRNDEIVQKIHKEINEDRRFKIDRLELRACASGFWLSSYKWNMFPQNLRTHTRKYTRTHRHVHTHAHAHFRFFQRFCFVDSERNTTIVSNQFFQKLFCSLRNKFGKRLINISLVILSESRKK